MLGCQILHVVKKQTLLIHHKEALVSLFLGKTLSYHFPMDSGGNTGSCRTSAKAEINLIRQLLSGNRHRCKNAAQCHDSCSLNIIVEGRNLLPIFLQYIGCISSSKILPVQIELREKVLCGLYKLLNKIVVTVSANSLMTIAKVTRIVTKLFSVRSAVNHKRQNVGGIDSCCAGIHHELSYGNVYPVGSPVSDSKNPLRVSHHDKPNFSVFRRIFQGLLNILGVIDIQICRILWIYKEIAIVLNGFCNGRVINNGVEFCEMLRKKIVEERTIGVENLHQEEPLFQIICLRLHLCVGFFRLLFNGLHVGR